MSYPLHAELYTVGDAVYRRPPYKGSAKTTVDLPVGGGDTADLYDDDDYEDEYGHHDDGPPCGIGENEEEDEEAAASEVHPVKTAAPIGPPPGFGVPPGLSAPPPSLLPITRPPPSASAASDPRVFQEADKIWIGSIDVPSNFHGLLIGQRGVKRKEMEDATQCRIIFPDKGSNSTTIRVRSTAGCENVTRCLDRIEATILSKQRSGDLRKTVTHFAAVPCNDQKIQNQFDLFKEAVLNSKNIDPSCQRASLFPSSFKLHFTICMLQLITPEEQERLSQTTFTLQERHSRRPLSMTIRGLDLMNDNIQSVHVLFAKIHGEGIQEFADDVMNELQKAGLNAKHERDKNVKLHMTVMNSRYAAYEETGRKDKVEFYERKPFDATVLMRELGNFEFGSTTIDRITVCVLSSKDETTGYYECYVDARLD